MTALAAPWLSLAQGQILSISATVWLGKPRAIKLDLSDASFPRPMPADLLAGRLRGPAFLRAPDLERFKRRLRNNPDRSAQGLLTDQARNNPSLSPSHNGLVGRP